MQMPNYHKYEPGPCCILEGETKRHISNLQGPQKEYLGKLQYELKYDFNTQARLIV